MLGLDPDGPLPLDVIKAFGNMPVSHAIWAWEQHGRPTPISGDPHFRPPRDSELNGRWS